MKDFFLEDFFEVVYITLPGVPGDRSKATAQTAKCREKKGLKVVQLLVTGHFQTAHLLFQPLI
jgi:hypothetical protein